MLSLRAINAMLRHFDAVDQSVSKRLLRKRPWPEIALTALLCDLLDDDTCADEPLSYPRAELLRDMASFDEPLSFSLRIDTHQYPAQMERYVTQADIGLIIDYQNQFNPDRSFRRPWLLQAKRAFPARRSSSLYDHTSAFESFDQTQLDRMRRLEEWAQCPFIRFLYYCPRPSELQTPVRERLSYLRTEALTSNIFDYALGLQLRDDLLSATSTVAAGMFVGALESPAKTIADVHAHVFAHSTPFSWFIVEHFSHSSNISRHARIDRRLHSESPSAPHMSELEKLVLGDARVLKSGIFDELGGNHSLRLLPAHTIAIKIVHGSERLHHNEG